MNFTVKWCKIDRLDLPYEILRQTSIIELVSTHKDVSQKIHLETTARLASRIPSDISLGIATRILWEIPSRIAT